MPNWIKFTLTTNTAGKHARVVTNSHNTLKHLSIWILSEFQEARPLEGTVLYWEVHCQQTQAEHRDVSGEASEWKSVGEACQKISFGCTRSNWWIYASLYFLFLHTNLNDCVFMTSMKLCTHQRRKPTTLIVSRCWDCVYLMSICQDLPWKESSEHNTATTMLHYGDHVIKVMKYVVFLFVWCVPCSMFL